MFFAGGVAECQFVEVTGLDFDILRGRVQHISGQRPCLPHPDGGSDFQVADGNLTVFVRYKDAVRGANSPAGSVRDVELTTGKGRVVSSATLWMTSVASGVS